MWCNLILELMQLDPRGRSLAQRVGGAVEKYYNADSLTLTIQVWMLIADV